MDINEENACKETDELSGEETTTNDFPLLKGALRGTSEHWKHKR